MIATSTCACTAVVHIFFRGQGQVPYLIRKIFLEFLARIFCMITPPVLPPAPIKKSAGQKTQQPATIITSVNNPSNQSNGNLLHHVNRTPLLPTANNRSSQQQNSLSCTALNNVEETQQLLNGSFQQHQNSQQQASHVNHMKNEYVDYGPQNMANNFNFNNNSIGFQTLPSQGRPASYQHNPHPSTQHVHSHQQNTQLNNDLNLSFNLIENDIKEIRDYLRHTRKKLENTDSKAKQTNEWKQVALVLDRTLFFIYIIAIIVSVTLMFPR